MNVTLDENTITCTSALTPDGGLINEVGALSQGNLNLLTAHNVFRECSITLFDGPCPFFWKFLSYGQPPHGFFSQADNSVLEIRITFDIIIVNLKVIMIFIIFSNCLTPPLMIWCAVHLWKTSCRLWSEGNCLYVPRSKKFPKALSLNAFGNQLKTSKLLYLISTFTSMQYCAQQYNHSPTAHGGPSLAMGWNYWLKYTVGLKAFLEPVGPLAAVEWRVMDARKES